MNFKAIKPLSLCVSIALSILVFSSITAVMYNRFIDHVIDKEREVLLKEFGSIKTIKKTLKEQFATLTVPTLKEQSALKTLVAQSNSISSIAVIHKNYFVFSTFGLRDRYTEHVNESGFHVKLKSTISKKPIIYYMLAVNNETFIRVYFKPLQLNNLNKIGEGEVNFNGVILGDENQVMSNVKKLCHCKFTFNDIEINVNIDPKKALVVFVDEKLGYLLVLLLLSCIFGYFFGKTCEHELVKYQIKNNRIKPYLQPIVDHNGNIIGAEILARWITNKGELVPPYLFIPYIEKEKLTPLLTCSLLAQIHNSSVLYNAKTFKLSFNLTELCLFEPKVYALSKRLSQHCRLVLEFTESTPFIREDTPQKMQAYRRHGVEFAIDDYGTGFSAPHYLTEYKFDYLKIDKCFIDNLDKDEEKSTHLVESIVFLATKMNLELVAEGVETDSQAAILKTLGLQYFQGFLFYKPMDLIAFSQLTISKSD
ncbi:hypothetical protein VT25_07335 [Photobacterium leiognathi subsp. mandapamensis]|nr:hypothetical protein VT25_07335 [Photobacterium leiognathi subsp. mandapamensis]